MNRRNVMCIMYIDATLLYNVLSSETDSHVIIRIKEGINSETTFLIPQNLIVIIESNRFPWYHNKSSSNGRGNPVRKFT